MFELIAQNLATIMIGAVVFAILAAVVIQLIKDHKNHRSSCSCCGCKNCVSSGVCHRGWLNEGEPIADRPSFPED